MMVVKNLVVFVAVLMHFGAVKGDVPQSIKSQFQKCFSEGGITGVVNCAGLRTLNIMDKLASQRSLDILPGVSLISDNSVKDESRSLKDVQLPEDEDKKSEKILELLTNSTYKLIAGRTLKVNVPKIDLENIETALDEGRAKSGGGGGGKRKGNKGGKGGLGGMMLGIGAKLMATIPLMLAGLKLLTLKALVVSKIALVVSAIVFFMNFSQKGGSLFGGSGHSSYTPSGGYPSSSYGAPAPSYGAPAPTYGVPNADYPYARRSLYVQNGQAASDSQNVAYSSYTDAN